MGQRTREREPAGPSREAVLEEVRGAAARPSGAPGIHPGGRPRRAAGLPRRALILAAAARSSAASWARWSPASARTAGWTSVSGVKSLRERQRKAARMILISEATRPITQPLTLWLPMIAATAVATPTTPAVATPRTKTDSRGARVGLLGRKPSTGSGRASGGGGCALRDARVGHAGSLARRPGGGARRERGPDERGPEGPGAAARRRLRARGALHAGPRPGRRARLPSGRRGGPRRARRNAPRPPSRRSASGTGAEAGPRDGRRGPPRGAGSLGGADRRRLDGGRLVGAVLGDDRPSRAVGGAPRGLDHDRAFDVEAARDRPLPGRARSPSRYRPSRLPGH